MNTQTMSKGFNQARGGYAQAVDAGTFSIEKAKRTNVLGHGIIAKGPGGFTFTAFTEDAALRKIEHLATFKHSNTKDSVLVVWRVRR